MGSLLSSADLRDVLARYPELAVGIPDHLDEVVRLATCILRLEANPSRPPTLPDDAPGWEHDYWARQEARL
jgi:hypothetical protein